jgi:hypothetical protein
MLPVIPLRPSALALINAYLSVRMFFYLHKS